MNDTSSVNRNVILYIASSLDGYIATSEGDLSFLSSVQDENEDYGYSAFIKTIDTVIMGRKTYDWVMNHAQEFPHLEKTVYIITRTARPAKGNIQFYTGELKHLIHELKSNPGKNIFIDGGAEIVNILLKDGLIDELIISVIPTLLGDGIKLFKTGCPRQILKLKKIERYPTELIQLHYIVKRTS
ncbi:MAG: dihydrofolate reductase family protein [Saprospiraceae bacterium]